MSSPSLPLGSLRTGWKLGVLAAPIALALAFLLAWISSDFLAISGWLHMLWAVLIGAGVLMAGWLALHRERLPRWLGVALALAAVLRLGAGAVWYAALPHYGYNSLGEKAGYVMADAHDRDTTAWELAQSDFRLIQAFRREQFRKADQYGGLLFLSANVYRYLGGAVHQPLMMVAVTAAFSSLAVLFTWAFARRAWGDRAAMVAAWGLAVYPEAVLLGSSQMREAFMVAFCAVSFYGLVRYSQDHSWAALFWLLGGVLFALPVSPPLAALLLLMLFLTALAMGRRFVGSNPADQRRLILVLAGLLVLVMLGLWFAWQQFFPRQDFDLITLVRKWIEKSAMYQSYLSRRASGWIQKTFRSTPEWSHQLLLLVYGILQPFLPAAVLSEGVAPVWYWIGVWRAAGWAVLLPFLVYAPLRAVRERGPRAFALGLGLAAWVVILAASYRSGSDQWDNVRYRSAFAALQVALAGWVWSVQAQRADPWLSRILAGVLALLAWFVPWYVRRISEFQWPVQDVLKTVGLGVVTWILFLMWDWARGEARPPGEQGLD